MTTHQDNTPDAPQSGDLILRSEGRIIHIFKKVGYKLRPIAFAMKFMGSSKVLCLTQLAADEIGQTKTRSINVKGFTWANLVGGARTKARGTLLVPQGLHNLGYDLPEQVHLWAEGYTYGYVGILEG